MITRVFKSEEDEGKRRVRETDVTMEGWLEGYSIAGFEGGERGLEPWNVGGL